MSSNPISKSPREIWTDLQLILSRHERQGDVAVKMEEDPGNFSKYLAKLDNLVKLADLKKLDRFKKANLAITKKFYDTFGNELDVIKSDPSFQPPVLPDDEVDEHKQGYTNALTVAQEDHIHTLKESLAFIKASHAKQEEMLKEQIVAQREQIAANREQTVVNKELALLIKRYAPQEKKGRHEGSGSNAETSDLS